MMFSMVIYLAGFICEQVFNAYIDVRALVNNDEGLQDGILQALEQYNTEQHITVRLPETDHDVNKLENYNSQ